VQRPASPLIEAVADHLVENSNSEWKMIFAARPDSPEILASVELLTEM
jgi:hypothetical protein